MRAAIHFHPPYERRIWLVHDHVTRFHLLEYMLVHVAIVWMNDDELVHVVQLEVVFHVIQRVYPYFVLVHRLRFRGLQLLK